MKRKRWKLLEIHFRILGGVMGVALSLWTHSTFFLIFCVLATLYLLFRLWKGDSE